MIKKISRSSIILLTFLFLCNIPAYSQSDSDLYITRIQLSLWNPIQTTPENEDVLGFRLNLLYGENRDLSGFDLGIVNSLTGNMAGLQAGLFNIDRGEMLGVQIGMDNAVGDLPAFGTGATSSDPRNIDMHGLQFGVLNLVYPAGVMNGVQIGLVNVADKAHGLQIGIINYVNNMTGVQIGLINYIENAEIYLSPFINACF